MGYYEDLEINKQATPSDIKKAYSKALANLIEVPYLHTELNYHLILIKTDIGK